MRRRNAGDEEIRELERRLLEDPTDDVIFERLVREHERRGGPAAEPWIFFRDMVRRSWDAEDLASKATSGRTLKFSDVPELIAVEVELKKRMKARRWRWRFFWHDDDEFDFMNPAPDWTSNQAARVLTGSTAYEGPSDLDSFLLLPLLLLEERHGGLRQTGRAGWWDEADHQAGILLPLGRSAEARKIKRLAEVSIALGVLRSEGWRPRP